MNERNYSKKQMCNVTTSEGMTMKKLEHMVVENEYAMAKGDQFGETSSVHLVLKEPLTVKSENKIASSSAAEKEITSTYTVTVL